MTPTASIPASNGSLKWLRLSFLAALALLAFGLNLQPLEDPDVFMHLRDGRYWVESHFQVSREPFAYTARDQAFDKSEWLFRIGSYLAWRLGGYNLLILLKAVLVTAALFGLGWLVYQRWRNLAWASMILGLGCLAPAMTRGLPERPFLFTYLFLPLALILLDNFRQGRPKAFGQIWWLAPLTALWANLHPGFMVLFPFLAAQLFQDLILHLAKPDPTAGRRAKVLGAVLLACAAASCLNPLGPDIYPFVLNTLNSPMYMKLVQEWRPPLIPVQPFFFVLLVVTWLAVIGRIRVLAGQLHIKGSGWVGFFSGLDWFELLPLLLFSWMALNSFRHIPLFVIASLPVLAGSGREIAARWIPVPLKSKPARTKQFWNLLAGTALVVSLLVTAAAQGRAFRLNLEPGLYPEQAVAWLDQQPWQGRLFTQFDWSAYLGWQTHNRFPIFMDGRMGTFKPSFFLEHHWVIKGNPKHALAILDQYRIQGVLLSPLNGTELPNLLRESGQWALVYWDDTSLLYARHDGPNQAWVETLEYRATDPLRTPFSDPGNPEQVLREILRAQTTAPRAVLPRFFYGDFLMRNRQADQAEAAFKTVLEMEPRHAGSHFNLAMLLQQRGQWQSAEPHWLAAWNVTQDPETAATIAYQLAANLREQKRLPEALAWVRKALDLKPDMEPALALKNNLENH